MGISGSISAALQKRQRFKLVNDFLDTERNRIPQDFRQALFQRTEGHPLFTIELLRALQARGDLFQDDEECWVVSASLAWDQLPDRVEAVIAERIGRLEEEQRELLAVASVEGEDFTAQVVARVQELDERHMLRQLSQELEKRHRLVREVDEMRANGRPLSRYRFAHHLFQRYLYNDLSRGRAAPAARPDRRCTGSAVRRPTHRNLRSVSLPVWKSREPGERVYLSLPGRSAGVSLLCPSRGGDLLPQSIGDRGR